MRIVTISYYSAGYIQRFLAKGLPIESHGSHLPAHLLHDYFLSEIAVKTIENKQDAMVTCLFYPYCLPLMRI
ncbi:hypothetical protein EDB89DRAFT_1968940 [Lactarius sanguifluus]|nr:hypothetical protein EDB89DRAFT_1968940 [Lactarius sanguifluus]